MNDQTKPGPDRPKSEIERDKKLREALFVMVAFAAAAFLIYWIVHAMFHAPNAALAVLIIGTLAGAGYYVYQVHKLKPKDPLRARR